MATFDASKRSLFRQALDRDPFVLRPPWAIDEYDFVETCRSCHRCISACEQSILKSDAQQRPIIDFSKDECTFCERCVLACESGALNNAAKTEPWGLRANISDGCLTRKNVVCLSCGEACENEAITFTFAINATAAPQVKVDQCNGCGACVSICPTNAIQISYQQQRVS